jgi:hypothetical protein
MPACIIHIIDGNWEIAVPNTAVAYQFVGNDLAAQAASVRGMAGDLQGEYFGGLQEDWLVTDGGLNGDEIAQQLFGTTDTLVYNTAPLYSAAGDDSLLDDIVGMAEVLIGALGAGEKRPT